LEQAAKAFDPGAGEAPDVGRDREIEKLHANRPVDRGAGFFSEEAAPGAFPSSGGT
jgi:hypothetical protein